jgi:ParB-like nuclease domain
MLARMGTHGVGEHGLHGLVLHGHHLLAHWLGPQHRLTMAFHLRMLALRHPVLHVITHHPHLVGSVAASMALLTAAVVGHLSRHHWRAHVTHHIPLDRIRDIENRLACVDPNKVERYRKLMREGVELPPIDIREKNLEGYHIIKDGHHRYSAARLEGVSTIRAIIRGSPLPSWWKWS